MNKPLCVQERGLVLLIGLAVLISGILVFTDGSRTGASVLGPVEPISLDGALILIPQFVTPAPIDINQASLEALTTLPGIGPALAARIIAYRNEYGPFRSIEDLEQVSGIGPQTVKGILDAGTATATTP